MGKYSIIIYLFLFNIEDNMFSQEQVQTELSLTEEIAFSTIRIETNTGVGTGFIFNLYENDSISVPLLVTNKHVIKNANKGTFILSTANPDGSPNIKEHIPVKFDNFESIWILHPDSTVDLAVMKLAPVLEEVLKQGKYPFIKTISANLIPSEENLQKLTAVEDILMVGYPVGLWDEVNNYPIFRRGITATHPFNEYNGRSEFIIDAACFPGSSGSPVFMVNIGTYNDKLGVAYLGTRIYFLGILYAGPIYTADGKLVIIDTPQKQDIKSQTGIPTNLGYVIKSKKILDFRSLIEFK